MPQEEILGKMPWVSVAEKQSNLVLSQGQLWNWDFHSTKDEELRSSLKSKYALLNTIVPTSPFKIIFFKLEVSVGSFPHFSG